MSNFKIMSNLTNLSESAKSLASDNVHNGANAVRLWRVFNSYFIKSSREAKRLASAIGDSRPCWSIPDSQLYKAVRELTKANCTVYIF